MRVRRSTLAVVAAGIVLAQVVGCGSCVKDDPQPTSTDGRKPINLKAADKRFSQFSDGAAAAAADASTD